MKSTLYDSAGKAIVSGEADVTFQSLGDSVAKLTLPVSAPQVWSVEHSTLYTMRTVVERSGVVVDELTIHNSFRTCCTRGEA